MSESSFHFETKMSRVREHQSLNYRTLEENGGKTDSD